MGLYTSEGEDTSEGENLYPLLYTSEGEDLYLVYASEGEDLYLVTE